MWNEWGHFWPLWDVEGPLDPDDLGLSDELGLDLCEWHARWEFLLSRDYPWRWEHPGAFERWQEEGDQLLVRLVGELNGRVSVVRAFRFPEDDAGLRLRLRRLRERR
jgi:hypothetical protein